MSRYTLLDLQRMTLLTTCAMAKVLNMSATHVRRLREDISEQKLFDCKIKLVRHLRETADKIDKDLTQSLQNKLHNKG